MQMFGYYGASSAVSYTYLRLNRQAHLWQVTLWAVLHELKRLQITLRVTMLPRTMSIWFGFRSSYPGLCSGAYLLISLMVLLYISGVVASLRLGLGGDFPWLTGNCFTIHMLVSLESASKFTVHYFHLRYAPVRLLSRWAALPAGQRLSPPLVGTMPRTFLGYSSLSHHHRHHSCPLAHHLLPGALCGRGWSNQSVRLLGHSADTVHSTQSPGDNWESHEVSASLVSPLGLSADWSAAPSWNPCPASLLFNMHWT